MISIEIQEKIRELFNSGNSIAAIARTLTIDYKTIKKYLDKTNDLRTSPPVTQTTIKENSVFCPKCTSMLEFRENEDVVICPTCSFRILTDPEMGHFVCSHCKEPGCLFSIRFSSKCVPGVYACGPGMHRVKYVQSCCPACNNRFFVLHDGVHETTTTCFRCLEKLVIDPVGRAVRVGRLCGVTSSDND
ncbi:MAG: hypothetical protein NT038_03565 [Euryarchaeota archaeon]|nr:hypothetical protein [Euryarchaeota archaeon]